MMTDCRYTLCLESLESPAGPGPEHGECPATRHQLRAPGRHLHRPVGQVAPEPDQEALNLTNFDLRSFKIFSLTEPDYGGSMISSHFVKSSIYFNNKTQIHQIITVMSLSLRLLIYIHGKCRIHHVF